MFQAFRNRRPWAIVLAILCLLALVWVLIVNFLFQPFHTASASMEPTTNPGDYFLVSKLAYSLSPPQRGDVVVFYSPAFKTDYVKRIVGLPGDRVQLKHGVVFINGQPLPQHRIPNFIEPCAAARPCQISQYEEALPGRQPHSVLDRIANGPADNTGMFRVPADSYFVLGDNRDDSNDSRTAVGFVGRADIVGRAAGKYIAGGQWTWELID